MPRMPRRQKLDDLSEAERNKRLIRQLIIKGVITFMAGIAIIYIIIAAIVGAGIFVPKTANQILDAVQTPNHYSWTSETVRNVTLAGQTLEQDAYRGAVVDTQFNRFQAETLGTLPDETIYTSDGKVSLYLTSAFQAAGGSGWHLASNYCNKAPAISAQLLTMPTAQEIKAEHPQVVTTQGTVYGQQAWVLSFHPQPAVLNQLLWINFFAQATASDPSLNNWVLSPEERVDFLDGHYQVTQADVWITRNKPRQLVQILVDVKTSGVDGSTWRLFAQRNPDQTNAHVLLSDHISTPDCALVREENGATGITTGEPNLQSPGITPGTTTTPSTTTTTASSTTSTTTKASSLPTTSATTSQPQSATTPQPTQKKPRKTPTKKIAPKHSTKKIASKSTKKKHHSSTKKQPHKLSTKKHT